MSKQKHIILLPLCIALILSVAVIFGSWLVVNVKAEDNPVDASINDPLRFLSVEMTTETIEGDSVTRIGFVINRNLGTNNADMTSPATDKVTYTEVGGGTRTLAKVRYVWDDFLPKLVFYFTEDELSADGVAQYSVGDSITIQSGFTFNNWDSSSLSINVTADTTVTYTEVGWTGSFLDSQLTNIQITNRNPGGINVDFGITGINSNAIYIDSSAWSTDNVAAWNRIRNYADYQSENEANAYNRFYVDAAGILTVTKGDDSLHPQAGDVFVLEKGFAHWAYTQGAFMGFGTVAASYVPIFVVNRDLFFTYDGSSWAQAPTATSAELANAEEVQTISEGQTAQIRWTLNEGAMETPLYGSSDTSIATVRPDGTIVGVSGGTVTITAQFANFKKEIEVEIEGAAEVVGFNFEIAGAATRDGTQYLVAYVGEALDAEFAASRLTATPIFDNGATGVSFDVTADMLDVPGFNNTVAGATTLSMTYEGVTDEIPVWLYEVQEVDAVSPSRLLQHGSGINIYLFDVVDDPSGEVGATKTIDFRGHPEYGITNTMATLVEPSYIENPATHELYTVGENSFIQMLVYFGGYTSSSSGEISIPVGSVLTFTENFRMFRNLDNTWVATYKFPGEVKYVWDGSAWQNYVDEANDFTLDVEEITLPCGASYAPEVTILPEGAYAQVSLESDEPDIVSIVDGEMVAMAPGDAVITVSLGKAETKTIRVTVEDTEPAGLQLVTNRTFYVSQGSQLDISKVRVRIDYGDGYLSDEITLSADTATFTQPDTSAAGTFTVSIACKVPDSRGEEIEGTISINVEVPEIVEMYPDNLTCADDNAWSGSMILIYFQNTFPNQANVYPEDLTEAEAATMTDNILFIREGAEVVVDHPGYLTNMLTFIPRINGEAITSYQTGDTILLKQGLCFYRWFGDKDAQNSPVGDGDFVKVGELKYDIPIVYNAQGKFAWQIAAVGGSAIEETVTVGLGQQHAANVTIIPSYATEGEWFYDVADETIASVSTTGMISGLKQGTTTVTATLRNLEGETITTVTFTVVVEDAVSGITITSDTPVVVDIGTELDVAGWIEQFGIKGYAVYASGTTGTEEIDLSGARVTGYDPETEGQQTLTFRVTVDGRSVVGRLTITVGASSGTEEGSGGCSGTVIGASMGAAAAVLVAGAAVLCIRKKKNI